MDTTWPEHRRHFCRGAAGDVWRRPASRPTTTGRTCDQRQYLCTHCRWNSQCSRCRHSDAESSDHLVRPLASVHRRRALATAFRWAKYIHAAHLVPKCMGRRTCVWHGSLVFRHSVHFERARSASTHWPLGWFVWHSILDLRCIYTNDLVSFTT